MTKFHSWKEMEEDATYTSYVKNQQTYHPHISGEHAHALSLSKIVSLAYRNQGSTSFFVVVKVANIIISTRINGRQKS